MQDSGRSKIGQSSPYHGEETALPYEKKDDYQHEWKDEVMKVCHVDERSRKKFVAVHLRRVW